MSEETFTIESLIESNNILQEEVLRLRNSNRILRVVHKALRATLDSQRAQLELAHFNDDTFKRFCTGEFDQPGQFDAVVVVPEGEGALPNPEGQAEGTV